MNRGRKILVLSHCILNQNSVVLPYGRKMLDFQELINYCLENNIGLIQLPCPEFKHLGLKRWGHLKTQLDYTGYRNLCKKLLIPIVEELEDYLANDYKVLGVCGIKGSPTCGVTLTCVGDWQGEVSTYKNIEDATTKVKMVEEKGILMEIFQELVKDRGININFFDFDNWRENIDRD